MHALLVGSALATLASSCPSLDSREQTGRAPTTERGLVVSVHMASELVRMARSIDLRVAWSTGLATNEPVLVVTPQDATLQPQRLTLFPVRDFDDAGKPLAGVQLWNSRYADIRGACSGSDECTLRFRIAPEPGTDTTDLAGSIDVSVDAVGRSGGGCGEHPKFPEAAAIAIGFEDIGSS